jgi:hypothetical protein
MSFKLAFSYKMTTMKSMNNMILLSVLACIFFFTSCQNNYRQNIPIDSTSQGIIGVGEDAYQVTTEEYGNYFESRYGLLYQKFNDRPFTGRILTVEKGEAGDYVSSDESWKEGKKDGLSARWFSNGTKMYERNYSEGRWHGTVTRWWPNGQKMYVRAYTNGTRHGKEATWRSDGSPIQLAKKPYIIPKKSPSSSSQDDINVVTPVDSQTDVFPPVVSPSSNVEAQIESNINQPFPSLPGTSDESTTDSFPSFPPESTTNSDEFPPLPGLQQESSLNPPADNEFPPLPGNDAFSPSGLPTIPDSPTSEILALPGSNDFPESPAPIPPSDAGGLPSLPSFPDPAGGDDLPDLPDSSLNDESFPTLPSFPDDASGGLPPLPGLPGSGGDDLAPLPSFPDDASGGLPPLPGLPGSGGDDLTPLPSFPDDASGGLPPLPGLDSSDGGLPPLPPFPE